MSSIEKLETNKPTVVTQNDNIICACQESIDLGAVIGKPLPLSMIEKVADITPNNLKYKAYSEAMLSLIKE